MKYEIGNNSLLLDWPRLLEKQLGVAFVWSLLFVADRMRPARNLDRKYFVDHHLQALSNQGLQLFRPQILEDDLIVGHYGHLRGLYIMQKKNVVRGIYWVAANVKRLSFCVDGVSCLFSGP